MTTAVPDAPGQPLDCAAGPACTLQPADDTIDVVLHRALRAPALLVLDVQYATFEPADREQGIATYGASWVARVGAA